MQTRYYQPASQQLSDEQPASTPWYPVYTTADGEELRYLKAIVTASERTPVWFYTDSGQLYWAEFEGELAEQAPEPERVTWIILDRTAELLGLSVVRVEALCISGRIGKRDEQDEWIISDSDILKLSFPDGLPNVQGTALLHQSRSLKAEATS